jgi:hypothetical protein
MRFLGLNFFILATILATILAPASGVSSGAKNQQQAFMLQFQSSRVSFPDGNSLYAAKTEGQYSAPIRFLLQDVLSWLPTGEGRPLSSKCATELWSARLQDARVRNSIQFQGALIQKYMKDCGEEIATGHDSLFANLTKMMTIRYDPHEHPFLHRVVFSLPGNIKLKGLLGLKGDFKKRPMIVIRLGIFANVEEFMAERAWLMMLFEQAPFNILVLENMSGTDFVADNSRYAFGGYDEAIQNILVAQTLKDTNEPLNKLIESLHLFGVSLGGHGVLYASLLNDLNSPKGQPLYQSFMGMCPVVNIEENMKTVTTVKPFSLVVDLWSQKRLAGLVKKMPLVEDHESFGFLPKMVSEVVRTYHGGLSYVSSVKLPEGVEDGPEFFRLNDFWKNYRNVQQPVLIFATHTDPFVPFAENAQLLQNKKLKVESSNISVVDFAEGIHCTLPIPYDWKTVSSILQSYFLSHSPNFKLKEQALEMELGDDANPGFYTGSVKVSYKVHQPELKDNFIRIAVEFENEKGQTDRLKLNLPLSQFDFHFFNGELSSSEQSMIERWVNQNLSMKVITKAGKPILRASWFVAP